MQEELGTVRSRCTEAQTELGSLKVAKSESEAGLSTTIRELKDSLVDQTAVVSSQVSFAMQNDCKQLLRTLARLPS